MQSKKSLKNCFPKSSFCNECYSRIRRRGRFSCWRRLVNFREMDRKIQCYLIEVLVRRVFDGGKRVLEIRKNWVMEMLGEMKDGSIGPAVGKCLVSVLMVRRAELMNESKVLSPQRKSNVQNGHSIWLETWKGPLLQTISGFRRISYSIVE